jgi:hypothetical protein
VGVPPNVPDSVVAESVVKAPVDAVPLPIGPGAANVAPLRDDAFRFGTLVVLVTTRGGVPIATVDVNCPVTLRLVPVAAPIDGVVSVILVAARPLGRVVPNEGMPVAPVTSTELLALASTPHTGPVVPYTRPLRVGARPAGEFVLFDRTISVDAGQVMTCVDAATPLIKSPVELIVPAPFWPPGGAPIVTPIEPTSVISLTTNGDAPAPIGTVPAVKLVICDGPPTVTVPVPVNGDGDTTILVSPAVMLTPLAGVFHTPLPLQYVVDDAPVPEFRLVTGRLPITPPAPEAARFIAGIIAEASVPPAPISATVLTAADVENGTLDVSVDALPATANCPVVIPDMPLPPGHEVVPRWLVASRTTFRVQVTVDKPVNIGIPE